MLTDIRIPPISWKGAMFVIATGLIFTVGQSTVGAWGGPFGWGPDFGIILIMYLGLKVSEAPGAVLACAIGLFRDAAGSGVFGFQAGVFLILYLIVSQVRKKVDPAANYYLVLFIFSGALVAGALNWLLLQFLGAPLPALPVSKFSPTALFIFTVFLTAAVGPIVFRLLDRLRPREFQKTDSEP
jgi:rod shape-determining protein MreD